MDGRSSKKIVPNEDALLEKNTLIGGRNVVLKVKRDEEFVMPSTMNPCRILTIIEMTIVTDHICNCLSTEYKLMSNVVLLSCLTAGIIIPILVPSKLSNSSDISALKSYKSSEADVRRSNEEDLYSREDIH
ncbi:hypothetical protein X798_03178 [Onchocerca flexuosa]|uniref:Uncharacterized protein n=1 Tax=Onchocerca flexuosa TaxID=387005 RepID=A0A238BYD1_9BILA|nr:hypothetical protein X798_03178 [Onchocerca flexuosa]